MAEFIDDRVADEIEAASAAAADDDVTGSRLAVGAARMLTGVRMARRQTNSSCSLLALAGMRM